MVDIADIGTALVDTRRARGLSQRDLGERLGVRQQQIARWEATAYRTATLERLSAVAQALGWRPPVEFLAAEAPARYGTAPSASDPEVDSALDRVGVDKDALAAFARSHGIERLELFGSVLTDEFRPDSDVDVLVTYTVDRIPSLFAAADHAAELEAIVRRRVDLVSRSAVERSDNEIRRDAILEGARTVYAAR